MGNSNRQGGAPLLDSDLIRQLINNQAQDIVLRKQELDLQKTQVTFSHEFALESLKAQKEDRMNQREHERRTQGKNMWIISIIIGIVAVFGGYCLWIDKDKVIEELLKFLAYSIPSLGGGYFYGYNKAKKKGAEDYTQED